MGIKSGFYQLIANCANTVKFTDIKGYTIVYDGFLDIYRAILGVSQITAMTDQSGEPTVHLNVILQNIVRFSKFNKIKYVFDNGAHELKREELESRTERREASTNDKVKWMITESVLKDVKLLVHLLGVDYYETAPGCEAEQLCASMTLNGGADAVMTNDADALLYGAQIIIKREKSNFVFYNLTDVLAELSLTQRQLIKLGVALGTDLAPKVKGVGIKTVVKKIKENSIEFDERQKEVITHFRTPCEEGTLFEGKRDIPRLTKWLVTKKGFDPERLEKILNKL